MQSYYTDLDRASGGQLLLFWVLVSKARIIDPNIQAILPRTPLRLGWRVAKEGRTLAKTENHLESLLVKLPSRIGIGLFHATLPPICVLCLGFWGRKAAIRTFTSPKAEIESLGLARARGQWCTIAAAFSPFIGVSLERPIRWADPSCSCETLRCFFFWKRFSSN